MASLESYFIDAGNAGGIPIPRLEDRLTFLMIEDDAICPVIIHYDGNRMQQAVEDRSGHIPWEYLDQFSLTAWEKSRFDEIHQKKSCISRFFGG